MMMTVRGSPNLATKVILLAAAAVVLSTGATYVAVSHRMWSELLARQQSEGDQHLRALTLVLAKNVPGVKVDLDRTRVTRVTTPPLSDFADSAIVDDSVSYVGGNATIFRYEAATDHFVRLSTNVKDENGERAIGTFLAPDSPAQAPVRTGHAYYGPTNLFGRHFYTVYQPTFDTAGKVNGILYVGIPIEFYFAAHRHTMIAMALVAAPIALMACAIIGILASRLFRPLNVLSRRIEALAAGELEVPIRVDDRRDEVGALARAVETLRCAGLKARALEAEQSASATRAFRRRSELDHAIASFRTAVSNQITRLAANTVTLRARAADMAALSGKAERIVAVAGTGSQESSAAVQAVASAAEELSASIHDIGDQLEHAKTLAGTAAQEAEMVDGRVSDLANAASRIGHIVSLIRSVADQTNLLALNATIEAARAGDAGRGFAVVATEVKALAAQTATATEEIADQITSVQASTNSTVDAIRRMTNRMLTINETTGAIASAVLAQDSATREISRNVAETALSSNEIAYGLVNVASAAAQTAEMAVTVNSAAESVDAVVAALNGEIESFLFKVAS